ncbi:MAG: ABC transporter ATP-binding protein [Cyanobacteria bacterium P01_H01_bin.15]
MKTGRFWRKLERALYLGRAFRLVWDSNRRGTLLIISLLCLQGLLPLVSLLLLRQLIDIITLNVKSETIAWSPIALWILGLGGVAVLMSGCETLNEYCQSTQGEQVRDRAFELLHSQSLILDLAYYEDPRYFDSLHLAQAQAAYRPFGILLNLTQLGVATTSTVALGGLLLILHPAIAGVVLMSVIPGTLVRLKYARRLHAWQRATTQAERQAGYFNWVLSHKNYAKEIRLFELGTFFRERFNTIRADLRHSKQRLALSQAQQQLIAQTSGAIAIYGSYGFITYQTVTGALTLGGLVMYFQALSRLQTALKGILKSLTSLYSDNLFLSHLYEFLDLKPQLTAPVNPRTVPSLDTAVVAFENVSFHYPGCDRNVLTDVSFTLKPGTHTALVGLNGSGKTTLTKLLCRLYDPSAGRITVDGIDLRAFSATDWRRGLSAIFQDYVRYELNVQDNIWLGDLLRPPDPVAIRQTAQHLDADSYIQKLPQTYNTLLGKEFGQGTELSIGQWQKLALARNYWRQAQLFILDEPSSALDPQAEDAIFGQISTLLKDKTTLIISHRLSTVRKADKILVLDGCSIVEQGNHNTLMNEKGLYAQLFETQAQKYY